MGDNSCHLRSCEYDAEIAIKTTNSRKHGLTHSIYNDHELAPEDARRFCYVHGYGIVLGLAMRKAEASLLAELMEQKYDHQE